MVSPDPLCGVEAGKLKISATVLSGSGLSGILLIHLTLLSTLKGIEETVLLYPSTGGRPRARRMLTEMDTAQTRLFDLFKLDAYAPHEQPT